MYLQKRPEKNGLYNPEFEHDSCGVGFVANIKGVPSHDIVKNAQQILIRMTHRGAVGAEKDLGDGAGILTAIPHFYFQDILGENLPKAGSYGAGIFFLPSENDYRQKCMQSIEALAFELGLKVLCWRKVPVDNTTIGQGACACEPDMHMLFLSFSEQALLKSKKAEQDCSSEALERVLFILRKRSTHRLRGNPDFDPHHYFHIPSLSTRILVYKGMLTPKQLFEYFVDLRQTEFKTHIAMVHSRFSTNTFPSWDRSQPLRCMSHNGEINTLRGNINKILSREGTFKSSVFGDVLQSIFPLCDPDLSDSGYFDTMLEFLLLTGRELPEAVMMMIPEAWQNDRNMDADKRAMYEYFSTMMEPWDGPASIVFTDGSCIGATLDRNGLRPSRYYLTSDDLIVMASEVGVLNIPEEKILAKGRVQPGQMFLVDFNEGRIISDAELKKKYSRAKPYAEWIRNQGISIDNLPRPKASSTDAPLLPQLRTYGYTWEHLSEIIVPMVCIAKEPLGSMGNDTPLAVLSDQPRLIYDYFKQLFAQVTNPPIDSVRESIVMSLKSYIGPEQNLLEPSEKHAHRILLEEPILTDDQLAALKNIHYKGDFQLWEACEIDITYPNRSGREGLLEAIERICSEVDAALSNGRSIAILSDRKAGRQRIPIPSLIALGAVHQYLVQEHRRTQIALILESAEPREVHHFCTLLGFGADAVNPYLAFEAIRYLQKDGTLPSECSENLLARSASAEPHARKAEAGVAIRRYLDAIKYGMLKVFAKMGISTLESYKAAQIFEAVGLADEVIDRCFKGTVSRIQGIGFEGIAEECQRRQNLAYPDGNPALGEFVLNRGDYLLRHGGEGHLWSAESIALLQMAVRQNEYSLFKRFSAEQDQRSKKQFTLRGLLRFKTGIQSIPINEVEPVEEIMKCFATGAMSFGSISQEAHETLAIAMNRIGGKSNTGEGGEMSERFIPLPNGDSKRSAIKQVASGRFGVTNYYLCNADEIQIKMAQGAKPGEGGELPGHKVFEIIARTRHTTPGVGLISPPPHHDIYSIEDLAQLIFDLKNANPRARISVKLVSEAGVGTIATGVVKGHADHILISGHDGGTGASPLTGIKHAGLPWELGIAETHQTLVLNDLRSRVVIQADGHLKTGRDLVIAAILGAEEFGFATSALITLGCIMMRKCHLNTCPVGIATQDARLRKKFMGKPDEVVNFMRFIAEEAREHMSALGIRSIKELVGRSDLISVDSDVQNWKSLGLDLSAILMPAEKERARSGVYCCTRQNHGIDSVLDRKLIAKAQTAIHDCKRLRIEEKICNEDRTVGTMLSHEIASIHGLKGLPDNCLNIKLTGQAGQSLGAWLASGVTIELEGDANDYLGKGLSGGHLAIYPSKKAKFKAENNIIIGNVAFYGAIKGKAFIRGMAAERFCVRNSGADVVVEGVGDHGCEYMTGGRVVILGGIGRNFAAGMSGGIAYIRISPPSPSEFPIQTRADLINNINTEMVEILDLSDQSAQEIEIVRNFISEHAKATASTLAESILMNWENEEFLKIISPVYQNILEAKNTHAEVRN